MTPTAATTPDDIDALGEAYARLREAIGRVVIGQEQAVEGVLITMLCGGHCLLVGVPGLAKTLLVQTIAQAIDLDFSRIQFTPDLMPGDITGTEVIEEDPQTGRRRFRFAQGPLFANVVLADEINRTPPKTQAALLQAMQEHEVTAAGQTYGLPGPFFVLATQNPIEQEGTYPLPEAQLDRFLLMLWMDYPSFEDEVTVVRATTGPEVRSVSPVLTADDLMRYQRLVREAPASDNLIRQAVRLTGLTRPGPEAPEPVRDFVAYGAGPRASQALVLAAKARALLDGRATPLREDLEAVAVPVLRHRVVTSFNAEAEGVSSVDVIQRLLKLARD